MIDFHKKFSNTYSSFPNKGFLENHTFILVLALNPKIQQYKIYNDRNSNG